MTTYWITYTSTIIVDVEANNEDDAVDIADQYVEGYTGADFRANIDITNIKDNK